LLLVEASKLLAVTNCRRNAKCTLRTARQVAGNCRFKLHWKPQLWPAASASKAFSRSFRGIGKAQQRNTGLLANEGPLTHVGSDCVRALRFASVREILSLDLFDG